MYTVLIISILINPVLFFTNIIIINYTVLVDKQQKEHE